MNPFARAFATCTLFWSAALSAQTPVGHASRTYIDPARDNRQIACEIYYPATSAGEETPAAPGTFPYVVFGHGFVMAHGDYSDLTAQWVDAGLVVVFVETEGGFAPNHGEFGLDLAFVADAFVALNGPGSGLLAGHVEPRCAVAGHSMGGGASWLAAGTSSAVECVVGLAPAETNPSAVGAAPAVVVPVLVLSGSGDQVTPPASNHEPIFSESGSACKVFVSLAEGSHCGYADAGTLCDVGELFFNGLDRPTQQAITVSATVAWFNRWLRDDGAGWAALEGLDQGSGAPHSSTEIECAVGVEAAEGEARWGAGDGWAYPNPVGEFLHIVPPTAAGVQGTWTATVFDAQGRQVAQQPMVLPGTWSGWKWAPGTYILEVTSPTGGRWTHRLVCGAEGPGRP